MGIESGDLTASLSFCGAKAYTGTVAFSFHGDCFALTHDGKVKKGRVLESDAAELKPGLLDLCGSELTV